MRQQQLFILADRELDRVVQRVSDDQWSMVMPTEFQTSAASAGPITLREVINYHAYDEAWVPDVLSGRAAEEVDGPTVEDDLLGADPRASFGALVETACSAVEALDDPGRTVHLSYGDYPASEFLEHVSIFRGLRAHDIALALDGTATLPDDLVRGLWEMLVPQVGWLRDAGVFGPEVPVPEDAPLQSRLLGLSGRRP